MSKKGGTIVKLVAFVAGVAAIGTACYVYRDKIKEFFEKIELKDKLDTAKSFVTDKVLGTKDDDFFDDAEFFDDEAEEQEDSSNRGYTSININSEDDEKPSTPVAAPVETPAAKTVLLNEQDFASEEEETAFEYEGLSDVSEDEDVLAEEATLDGTTEF